MSPFLVRAVPNFFEAFLPTERECTTDTVDFHSTLASSSLAISFRENPKSCGVLQQLFQLRRKTLKIKFIECRFDLFTFKACYIHARTLDPHLQSI